MVSSYKEKWTVVKALGGGGQGTTYLVEAKSGGAVGVLKLLKNQRSEQARRRMYQEVSNLRILKNASCKVPVVLDANVEAFEDANASLYFVMEHIPGQSLREALESRGGLDLQTAIEVADDLARLVEGAAKESVIHRDLKPENIIVRSLSPVDIVVVDYGLSFNSEEPTNITEVGEALDNRFLSLPERRVHGGDRRDPRSDITAVAAVLYYCIIGEPPVDLVDADGKLPHRRAGRSPRDKLKGDPRALFLESLFDRAFSPIIDNRFQDIREFRERLSTVLLPVAKKTDKNPADVARRAAELFLLHDRATQIGKYKENAESIQLMLNNKAGELTKKIKPFSLTTVGRQPGMGLPPDVDNIDVAFCVFVLLERKPNRMTIGYEVGARGTQCAVFRQVAKAEKAKQGFVVVEPWRDIYWFEGLSKPAMEVVSRDFESCVVDAMETIQTEILGHM